MKQNDIEIIEGDRIGFVEKLKKKILEGWSLNYKTYTCLNLSGRIVYSIMVSKEKNDE